MIKVCLIGIGRTGGEIARTILEQKDMKLVAAFCTEKSGKAGRDIGEVLGLPAAGIQVYSSEMLPGVLKDLKPDVAVDFSNSKATMSNARILCELGIGMVIGTTGFSRIDLRRLIVLSRKFGNGILFAPNITLGVNVMMLLSNIASSILNDYDFQITEVHHKYKKDAPSGTALKIAAEVERGLNASDGNILGEDIPIHSVRVGGVIGRHELMIAGENDKIEIVHESLSRKAFAAGTVRGIHFITGKRGFYEMSDVLELEKVLGVYLESKKRNASKRLYRLINKNFKNNDYDKVV